MPRKQSTSRTISLGLGIVSACFLLMPVLASARSSASDGNIWTGTWRTEWGTVKLVQDGHRVTGTYSPGKGKIEDINVLHGLSLEGHWSDVPTYRSPNDAGELGLTLAADGQSFSGVWRYGSDGEWNKGWNGKRRPPRPPP